MPTIRVVVLCGRCWTVPEPAIVLSGKLARRTSPGLKFNLDLTLKSHLKDNPRNSLLWALDHYGVSAGTCMHFPASA
jgi:hypothetical protein